MPPIYEPRGRAREYSPYALNFYNGCTHRCKYCYVPRCTHSNTYFDKVEPRPNIIPILEKQLVKEKFNKQVLLSFIGDPYNPENSKHDLTWRILSILLANKIPAALLTKGGTRCLKDMDTFKKFNGHIKVGATLTFIEEKDSLEFEPGAPLPANRFEALKELHRAGIKTWASIEPVIFPDQALRIIEETHGYVDQYKVGKINNMKEFEDQDWNGFLDEAVSLLRSMDKPFYVKHSLQIKNKTVNLIPEEIDHDRLCVSPF